VPHSSFLFVPLSSLVLARSQMPVLVVVCALCASGRGRAGDDSNAGGGRCSVIEQAHRIATVRLSVDWKEEHPACVWCAERQSVRSPTLKEATPRQWTPERAEKELRSPLAHSFRLCAPSLAAVPLCAPTVTRLRGELESTNLKKRSKQGPTRNKTQRKGQELKRIVLYSELCAV
jgi:hypothetical protein